LARTLHVKNAGLERRASRRRSRTLTYAVRHLAAIALAEAQRTDQLNPALANRDMIGQAKGILMERNRITAEAAFKPCPETHRI